MKEKIILIGASTGGPGHLKKILSNLDIGFSVPIVIAQHMNSIFVESFVKQFDTELSHRVYLANERHIVKEKHIFVCAKHCGLSNKDGVLSLNTLVNVDSVYNPSVDALFLSALDFGKKYDVMAILLTGIGHDGAKGLAALRQMGFTCIAESEKSAIVYGMPKKAVEIDPKIEVMTLDEIIQAIQQFGRS